MRRVQPQFIIIIDFQLYLIFGVRLHGKSAADLFALLCGDVIFQIENCLLPMSVGHFWS